MEIRNFIREYIEDGKPILNDEILLKEPKIETDHISEDNEKSTEGYSGIENEIISILNEYIK